MINTTKKLIASAALALLAVTATSACEVTHPNDCVEWIGNPGADGTLEYVKLSDGPPTRLGAWVHKTTGNIRLYSQDEDARTYRTIACVWEMPAYFE